MKTRDRSEERAYRARKAHRRVECDVCKEKGIAVHFLDTVGGNKLLEMHNENWHEATCLTS